MLDTQIHRVIVITPSPPRWEVRCRLLASVDPVREGLRTRGVSHLAADAGRHRRERKVVICVLASNLRAYYVRFAYSRASPGQLANDQWPVASDQDRSVQPAGDDDPARVRRSQ